MLLQLLAAAALLDTANARPDTVRRPSAPAVPQAALVRIAADDSAAVPVAFTALGAELRLEAGAPAKGGKPSTAPAELRVSKRTDALTPLFASRLASGGRLAAVTVELPGAGAPWAGDTLRVRLVDVVVTAERLVFPAVAPDVEGQRLAQEVTVSQVAADREEAARQLAEAEALAEIEARDRRKLVPANALARARDQVRLLDLRLAAARRQLALVEERVARGAAPTEEVTLRAERVEVLGAGWP
jgi:hypothetical protein